jgi:hypothetical protein
MMCISHTGNNTGAMKIFPGNGMLLRELEISDFSKKEGPGAFRNTKFSDPYLFATPHLRPRIE